MNDCMINPDAILFTASLGIIYGPSGNAMIVLEELENYCDDATRGKILKIAEEGKAVRIALVVD